MSTARGGVSAKCLPFWPAPPHQDRQDSQHLIASLCTPGPGLNFQGSPGDLGVPEAGWSPGPNAGL